MRIPTRDIPQADDLALVVRATEAVGEGANTYQGIAAAIGQYAERQGRYYRLAAELLGFIQNIKGRNHAKLTGAGRSFLSASPEVRRELLARAVLGSRMIQRVLPLLEDRRIQGISKEQLRQFIIDVTEPAGPSMVRRRLSSILGWLTAIELVRKEGDRYFLKNLPEGVEVVEYEANDEPLLPTKYDLSEYQESSRRMGKRFQNITVLINEAAHERARSSHRSLTELVARKVRAAGSIPRSNRLIDLSACVNNTPFVFEMKSTTPAAFHSQVRKAVAQLYEYRYIQQIERARLVVVTEHAPPRELHWIVKYLLEDRQILLAWDGDGKTIDYPPEVDKELSFLK